VKKKNKNENHSALGEAETKTENDAEEKSPGNMGRGGKIQDGEHPNLDTTQKE
jgi:hypothetical protein